MTNDNKELLQIMLSEFSKVNQRLDKVDSRLNKMDSRLDGIDSRLDKVESRLDKVESRLDKVEAHLDKVDSRLDKIENRLNILELKHNKTASKLDALQLDVKLAERNIRLDIHLLKDAYETIEQVLKIHKLVPI